MDADPSPDKMDQLITRDPVAPTHRASWFILTVILALAATLRIFNLNALGYWTDELCTLSCSHGWGLKLIDLPLDEPLGQTTASTRLANARSWSEIPLGIAKDDDHPPLYFLSIRAIETFFGDGESAVRSLNVAMSLLAIVLLFIVARQDIGDSAALCAVALFAVASGQIEFAQEARNYMPVLTFSLLAAACLQHIGGKRGTLATAGFAIALLLMMLTHYFAAAPAAALTIFALNSATKNDRIKILAAIAAAAVVFIGVWGWAILLQRSHFHTNTSWVIDTGEGHLARVLWAFWRAPARLLIEPHDHPWAIAVEWIGGLIWLLLPWLYWKRRELRLYVLWFISPILLVLILDLSRSTLQTALTRYTLAASPALFVLLAALIRNRARLIVICSAMAISLICLPGAYSPPWKRDLRTPVDFVSRQMKPNDALVITGNDKSLIGVTTAAFQHYMPAMPTKTFLLTHPPNVILKSNIQSSADVWIVWTWLDRNPQDFFPGIQIIDQGQAAYDMQLIHARWPAKKN